MNLETHPNSPYFVPVETSCCICWSETAITQCSGKGLHVCDQPICENCVGRNGLCADCCEDCDQRIMLLLVDGPRNLILRAFTQLDPAHYSAEVWDAIRSRFECFLLCGVWDWIAQGDAA